MFNNRFLVSFAGPCSLRCKHCYTFAKQNVVSKNDYEEIDSLISSVPDECDIVYVSHDRENFIDENAGIKLVKDLFEKKHKSILIITRSLLSDDCIYELSELNKEMNSKGEKLLVAVSIPAKESYTILEEKNKVGTPKKRMEIIKKVHDSGINTILMIRPLMPDSIIPLKEVFDLINITKENIDAVVSSGLAVNPTILERLGFKEEDFSYMEGNNSEFLIGAEVPNIKYVDTDEEIKKIEDFCRSNSILFRRHSLDAVNAICG